MKQYADMNSAEKREFKKQLIQEIIISWTKQGMTLEEAKALWVEMDKHDA